MPEVFEWINLALGGIQFPVERSGPCQRRVRQGLAPSGPINVLRYIGNLIGEDYDIVMD